MMEKELRASLVRAAEAWVGCKESNGTHRPIIDLYNSHYPLARGYKVKYTDAWCAAFASAAAIRTGLTGIIPTECSCSKQIELFKAMGCWVEDDAYVPHPGDLLYYDWQDDGKGDNTGSADHVGIVTACDGKTITVIEGNKNNSVGYREILVNGKTIRGFGVPDYESEADKHFDYPWDCPDWAKEAWKKAVDKGMDNERPRDNLTRAEAVTLLDKLGLL